MDTKVVRIANATALRIFKSHEPMSAADRDEILAAMNGTRTDTSDDVAINPARRSLRRLAEGTD